METKRFIMLSSSKRGFLIMSKTMKEQIKFESGDRFDSGGSRKGSITATFSDLERMFGTPTFEGKGDHITTEFVVRYEHTDAYGDVEVGAFSLYDWGYGRNFADPGAEVEWNIGGKSFMDGFAPIIARDLFEKTDIVYGEYDFDKGCLATDEWFEVVEPDHGS